ncbi:transposase [Persicitalea jodogahamensis]
MWDGANIHYSQAVKDFLASRSGRVHLVALPGYNPELNPVELLGTSVKRN